ncbi:23S rRNA (uracil(1939)-C(5))-methyltransferase RlmD [Trichloromonas sp.]|uniref:23S rRNA (uracil(1939)-C(5))-methyltransferase RlmD n=1 Tax=Trichloromonas sp. TaxID=3069249 RepID=UPI003D818002
MIDLLRIDSLAYGGNGVGRHEGKAVFVPHTAPGDLLRCRVTREKKRYAEADLTELVEPSSLRRTPPCPVFGRCGGCQWQHLPYREQGEWKERIFRDTLVRQCALPAEKILPLAAAPDEWGYRSRVQFKCRQTENGFVMGFYRRGSHFVIDVEHCPIAASAINEALASFRGWLAHSPCPERVPQVDLAVDDEGRVRAVVHVLDGQADVLANYLRPLVTEAGYALFLQAGRKDILLHVSGESDLHIRPLADSGLRLAYGPGGFAQVNLEQNRRLVAAVLGAVAGERPRRILDLCCGMGNFSLPLAGIADEVFGVEDYAPSIDKARQNAAANLVENARFHARPAEGAYAALAGGGFDLVVLDPPRTGAYQVARELAAARPSRIVYVSCDPPTLARDLVPLLHAGFRVQWSRPVDLFPQTYHTESVTSLVLPE